MVLGNVVVIGENATRLVSDLIPVSSQFAAIPSPLSEEDGYHIHPEKIADEIARGTSVILTSNPRNPTGHVVKNPELAQIQDICRGRVSTKSFDKS